MCRCAGLCDGMKMGGRVKKNAGGYSTMNRREVLQALDSVREMSDHEVTINAQFIRDIAGAAYMHIKGAEKIRLENQKLRARLRVEGRKDENRKSIPQANVYDAR